MLWKQKTEPERCRRVLGREQPVIVLYRMLIAKVYEVDPLNCPCCGSETRLIAVIADSFVREILRHLLKIGRTPETSILSPWSK